MPGDRVDGLHFATKTRQATGIDQGQLGLAQALAQLRGIQHQAVVRLTAEGAFTFGWRVEAQRQPGRVPGFEAAIQDRYAAALA
ncbi:hypothetical protein D9M71_524870 [compost metagenome]